VHVHCIVTGGGLATDGSGWVRAPENFLFPVYVLGALFRGKFLAGLQRLRTRGLLRDECTDRAARRRRARLYNQSWVVYTKRPFFGVEHVYRYLGRYTHRVAISNRRLISIDDSAIVFHTRDGKTAALPPLEFIRRFLQHRLPKRFTKIRHSGLLAPQNVNTAFVRARQILAATSATAQDLLPDTGASHQSPASIPTADLPWTELLFRLTGFDVTRCPACGRCTLVRLPLPPARAPPA
jgi:hypothetical protein